MALQTWHLLWALLLGPNIARDPYMEGITRYISSVTPSVPDLQNQFALYWMGNTDPNRSCNGNGACWIQVGYYRGHVGGITNSGPTALAYAEVNGTDGFPYQAIQPNISLSNLTYYGSFKAGYTDAQGHPYHNAYINQQFAASTPLVNYHNRVDVNLETYTPGLNTCPGVNGIVYFGTPGTNTYDPNWSLFKSTDGTNYTEWVATPTVTSNSPYNNDNIHHWSAFKVWGG